jgi:hypothetical protein
MTARCFSRAALWAVIDRPTEVNSIGTSRVPVTVIWVELKGALTRKSTFGR